MRKRKRLSHADYDRAVPILVGGPNNPYANQQYAAQQPGMQQPYQYGGAHSAGQYGAQQQSLPPAGWYADPELQGQSRYWDGNRWV